MLCKVVAADKKQISDDYQFPSQLDYICKEFSENCEFAEDLCCLCAVKLNMPERKLRWYHIHTFKDIFTFLIQDCVRKNDRVVLTSFKFFCSLHWCHMSVRQFLNVEESSDLCRSLGWSQPSLQWTRNGHYGTNSTTANGSNVIWIFAWYNIWMVKYFVQNSILHVWNEFTFGPIPKRRRGDFGLNPAKNDMNPHFFLNKII